MNDNNDNDNPVEAFMFRGWQLQSIGLNKDSVILSFCDNERKPREFVIYHQSQCCESNYLTDAVFSGRVNELFNQPLTVAEQEYTQDGPRPIHDAESYTWSHYKFGTADAYVDLWFLGESNGFYGETTEIYERQQTCKPS